MYKGTHRLVKIYQGMKTRTKVAVVGGVLAVGLAAGIAPSFAATSSVSYADTSATVASVFSVPLIQKHTLTVVATGVHSSASINIPSVVGSPSTQISPIVNGDTLTFTATNNGPTQTPDTFVITSTNVPTGVTWSQDVVDNADTLTAQVASGTVFPLVPATVTAKVTDAIGDVTFDTVTFSPAVAGTNTAYNVWQVQDAVKAITPPLFVNNNTTGEVDFTVPTGDAAVLSNAPDGVAMVGNSLAASSAAPGTYKGVKLTVTDAANAASVETFTLNVKGARVGYQGPVLSQGHAVKINAVREWVYFVLSGKDTWVHFTIVGPGGINGHQGWVNAHVGLNAGFYAGLEANHGYAVYYQPVTGRGSTVPVPGSSMGHVWFKSNA